MSASKRRDRITLAVLGFLALLALVALPLLTEARWGQ